MTSGDGAAAPAAATGSASATGSTGPASSTAGSSATLAPGELPAAAAIPGVTYHTEPDRARASGVMRYDTSPPVGGRHNFYWADCTGTIDPQPIANENAVHMLEHGAVWVTYPAGLDPAEVASRAALLAGVDHTALSPYPALKSAISLQSWGYQLFVDDPTDPGSSDSSSCCGAIRRPHPSPGASCSQPAFKAHPSTLGHPLDGP